MILLTTFGGSMSADDCQPLVLSEDIAEAGGKGPEPEQQAPGARLRAARQLVEKTEFTRLVLILFEFVHAGHFLPSFRLVSSEEEKW